MTPHAGRTRLRRFVTLGLTPLFVAWLGACHDSTAPEINRMVGRIDGQSFAGTAQANLSAFYGSATLSIWGMRQDVEETISLHVPWDSVKVGTPVRVNATVMHTVGWDVLVGQYDGTGVVTISEVDDVVVGTFQFDAQTTYGSAPRYGPSVSFTNGRFRAKVLVSPEL